MISIHENTIIDHVNTKYQSKSEIAIILNDIRLLLLQKETTFDLSVFFFLFPF